MSIEVAALTGLDICRDGGSLSASFTDPAGDEWTLFFPVKLASDPTRRIERIGYLLPISQRHIRTRRISPITGLESIDSSWEESATDWNTARELLAAMTPLVEAFNSQYGYVFQMMVEVATKDGAVEAAVE